MAAVQGSVIRSKDRMYVPDRGAFFMLDDFILSVFKREEDTRESSNILGSQIANDTVASDE